MFRPGKFGSLKLKFYISNGFLLEKFCMDQTQTQKYTVSLATRTHARAADQLLARVLGDVVTVVSWKSEAVAQNHDVTLAQTATKGRNQLGTRVHLEFKVRSRHSSVDSPKS